MFRKFFGTGSDLTPVFQRLALALVIFPHGAQKVLGWFGGYGFDGTLAYFTGQGLPAPVVLLVFAAEFLGPLGLVTGFLTRLSALGIGLVMLGATLTVHLPNGFFMNWMGAQAGEGFEYHLLALALAIPLVVNGAGRWSLDGLLAKRFAK
jgi:putative oxidoreductase